MKAKKIKRRVRKELKKLGTVWNSLSKKDKKLYVKNISDAILAEDNCYDEVLEIPIEELIGIDGQQINKHIMTIHEMSEFINNFDKMSGVLFFKKENLYPEIKNEELKFINNLLDDRILNYILAPKGYSPQTRDVLPAQLFRAELLKAIKYPEISYRKFCTDEYLGMERKENRRFLGLSLRTKEFIHHTELCHFRCSLSFSAVINLLVFFLHHFYESNLLEDCLIHGVDSTEIANDNRIPLHSFKVGNHKVRIYSDIDCDCGIRRNKRDKSKFVVGYRMHTLTAINPATGHAFPLISLLGPANHHDSLFLKPLIDLAQAMGIDIRLITADEAYHDKDGKILSENKVHVITPPSLDVLIPQNVDPDSIDVTCSDNCEIPMVRMGLTEEGHEFKCGVEPGECFYASTCPRSRIIPFDSGYFQRMPIDNSALTDAALDIRKNIERPFNLLKNREGLDQARVRSQHGLVVRSTVATIATLLIEMAGTRKKAQKQSDPQQKLFAMAA